jgi:hypothetical protein
MLASDRGLTSMGFVTRASDRLTRDRKIFVDNRQRQLRHVDSALPGVAERPECAQVA